MQGETQYSSALYVHVIEVTQSSVCQGLPPSFAVHRIKHTHQPALAGILKGAIHHFAAVTRSGERNPTEQVFCEEGDLVDLLAKLEPAAESVSLLYVCRPSPATVPSTPSSAQSAAHLHHATHKQFYLQVFSLESSESRGLWRPVYRLHSILCTRLAGHCSFHSATCRHW